MADNSITVIGNITRDPELRYTPSGQQVATFGLAVNRRWQNRQNQNWEESTSFFDVTCWGSLADNVSDSIGKGTRCVVTGRLEQRSWETQEGEKRSKVEIVADEVGPSLRWATAKVERSDRRNGGGPGGQTNSAAQGASPGGGSGYAQDTGQGAGGYQGNAGGYGAGGNGGGSVAAPAGSPAYSEDEEPF